ncbi:Putative O-methyltransferase [Rickettsiales bacterium Ac37b]|nr:Putative O-methyltransferase [Rickettsiales bacterium Ac37b]
MRTSSTNLIHDYIKNLFAKEDELLLKIDNNIKKFDLPIHISPEEGKLLYLLLSIIQARKVIEVGTLAGYSTIWIARALIDGGEVHTIEHDQKRQILAEQTFRNFRGNSKIILHKKSAKEALKELSGEAPFDAIFIDADKVNYPKYLDWAEENLRYRGLIIGDNTLLSGSVYGDRQYDKRISNTAKEAIHEFNLRLADEKKYISILLPSQDGITIALKIF